MAPGLPRLSLGSEIWGEFGSHRCTVRSIPPPPPNYLKEICFPLKLGKKSLQEQILSFDALVGVFVHLDAFGDRMTSDKEKLNKTVFLAMRSPAFFSVQ